MQNQIIDWLSFTIPTIGEGGVLAVNPHKSIAQAMESIFSAELLDTLLSHAIERGPGRRPYQASIVGPGKIYRIFYSTNRPEILFEFSGRGCEWLRGTPHMPWIWENLATNLTRVDLAVDIETATKPANFVSAGYSARFQSRASFASESGLTEYVGSMKSEQFARVYRYTEPHPRAAYLRIEHVFRRDKAKKFASEMARVGLEDVTQACIELFDWKSAEIASTGERAATLTVSREKMERGKTERWLISQAAPAFKRLIEENIIENPEEWLRDHFLPGLLSRVD